MDLVLQKFLLRRPNPMLHRRQQGTRRVLLDDSEGKQIYGEPRFQVRLIDCLANGGGTVFMYLCVNDNLIKRKKMGDFSISFSIEANCRGMMCRTVNGFLEHETVSKGKKFEAAWRRFGCQFLSESRSHLLMVLVQSGQDTEMGSVTCTKSVDNSSSSKTNSSHENNSIVKFFKPESGVPSTCKRDDDYESLGIFSGTDLDSEFSFDLSSRNGEILSLDDGCADGFDADLERALALSRGDVQIQESLEQHNTQSAGPIRQDPAVQPAASTFEREIERAILESSKMASVGLDQSSFDHDLEKAMQLSLRDDKPVSSPTVLVDLSWDDGPEQRKPSPKRRKTDPSITQSEDYSIVTGARSMDEKRKLAAEAALKRFQS